jgi:hypothetical protein
LLLWMLPSCYLGRESRRLHHLPRSTLQVHLPQERC